MGEYPTFHHFSPRSSPSDRHAIGSCRSCPVTMTRRFDPHILAESGSEASLSTSEPPAPASRTAKQTSTFPSASTTRVTPSHKANPSPQPLSPPRLLRTAPPSRHLLHQVRSFSDSGRERPPSSMMVSNSPNPNEPGVTYTWAQDAAAAAVTSAPSGSGVSGSQSAAQGSAPTSSGSQKSSAKTMRLDGTAGLITFTLAAAGIIVGVVLV